MVWRAPELLQSEAVSPHTSADIFSFGRLLFRIIAGQRPLQAWQPKDIIHAARFRVTPLLDWPVVPLVRGVKAISEMCTHFEPRLRPDIIDLNQMLEGACMDCWPVDNCAVPLKDAVAELRRIDTSRPGAADHRGRLLAGFVDKSSPGLSSTMLESIPEHTEFLAGCGQPSPRDEYTPATSLITEPDRSGRSPSSKRSL